jgi:hypothetical protein
VGTLLEMVRDMATALALDGKRVKVCVQAAMGQGVFQVGADHVMAAYLVIGSTCSQ